MPFEAVDHDPFAGGTITIPGKDGAPTRVIMNMGQTKLEPVDHDPFAATMGDTAVGLGNAFGGGVEKLASSTLGALGDLTDVGAAGIGAASNYINDKLGLPKYERPTGPSILDNIPHASDIQAHLNQRYRGDKSAGPYQPQNGPERYAQAAGEFLMGGAGGVGRKILQRIGQVALPAVASETAGHAVEGKPIEPLVRFGGALAGGGLSALASRPGSAASSLGKQLPAGVTPAMVDQAGALIATAKQRGIDLAWPEALSQVAGRPVLTNAMRHLEASPQTEAKMGEFFGQRPQQIENAARTEFNAIAPQNNAPSSIGPAIGRAAGETVSDVRGLINRASEPYYKAAESQLFTPQEFAAVKQVPGYKDALKAVREAPDAWRISHLPDNSVGVLDKVKQHFDTMAQNAGSKFNPAQNQSVKSSHEMSASAVKQIGEAKSPEYAVALGVQKQAREQYLQPLLDGPLGKLAKKDPTTQKAINALFPADPLANSQHEISTAVSALAMRNPTAARDLVRAHAEGVFNAASKDLQTGANQAGGAKFRAALIGDRQQRANLRAAVEELPSGKQKWDGFKEFLDVLEATGTRQNVGSRTAYNAEINKAQGAGGLVKDATKIAANPIKAFQPIIDKYEQYKLGKNLSQLADILTDPRSGPMLKAIAGMPKGSSGRQMAALKLITYADASSSVNKPNK